MSNKVVIVEDEMLIRKQLVSILAHLNYDVTHTFSNSDIFLDKVDTLQPDIFLFDINIKGSKSGIELAQIVRDKKSTPFIFITSYADRDTIEAAKVTRPNGYVIKPFDERDIMTVLEIALYNAQSTKKSSSLNKQRIESKNRVSLTEREFVTLIDLTEGMTNRQIAEKQYVSINTVKTHLKNLFAKLEVKDRVSLVKKVL